MNMAQMNGAKGWDETQNFQDGGQDGLYPRIEIVCTSPRFQSDI